MQRGILTQKLEEMKSKNLYYRVYEWLLMAATLVFLLVVYVEIPEPTEYYQIYPDAIIKAVDPLEILKKGVGNPSDRAGLKLKLK